MKIGFIGLGRMGRGMARRLLEKGFDLSVYGRNPERLSEYSAAGASLARSIPELCEGRDLVINMLPHDEALESIAFADDGLLASLPKGAIHMPMGTHSVELIQKLTQLHKEAGQTLVAGPVLGRPDFAASGQLTLTPSGPEAALEKLQPVFDVLGRQTFVMGDEPCAASAAKIAHNFVLGCAIEAMGEGVALGRKYGVAPEQFIKILTKGLFSAPAYEIYGQIIADESYDNVGASVQIGLKDANLALAAGEAASVPLPSCNVWRDRLIGAIANGDENCDWAVMAKEQARASGLED